MARRNKKPSGLEVRVSHEETRHSEAWLAAAFDVVVPTVQRRVERSPARGAEVGTTMPKCAKSMVRR
jgi:hypothetical protein